ncbi:MAG TPA: hypothetical protein VFE62_20070 [Gemmataceae bacterium]|nr:hypothetical protein [Gemmataceae bacterium]
MNSEPTNANRADWAKEALAVFTARTFSGDQPDLMCRHDLDSAIKDLICDLLHYARQHALDVSAIVQQAFRNFAVELVDEEMNP